MSTPGKERRENSESATGSGSGRGRGRTGSGRGAERFGRFLRSAPPSPRDWARQLAADEIGAVIKPFGAQTPIALVYPNTYRVGMSSLGFQSILGRIQRREDASCERFFWRLYDKDEGAPVSIENRRGLDELPLVAFSVSFEMDYWNMLDTLRRAGIPLRWKDRGARNPVVICGGKAPSMNRLPLYDFADVFVHGDGEEAIDRALDAWNVSASREDFLGRLAALPGFEVPPLTTIPAPEPPAALSLVERLAEFPCRSSILTKNTEFGMRALVEISRGCPYNCAFCLMGHLPHPYRFRPAGEIVETILPFLRHTNKVGLVASAVGIHRDIEDLCERLDALDVDVAFSSLRIEDVKPGMIRTLIRSGQKTLTVAPEVGNERLRRSLRKNLDDARIEEFVAWAFAQGMENLKLYYMIGIPGETDEDVLSIARQTRRLHAIQVQAVRARGHIGRLAVNVGVFVPKPGTPLAGEDFCGAPEGRRRILMLKRAMGAIPNVKLHCESPRDAAVQALLASGTRATGELIERAVIARTPIPTS